MRTALIAATLAVGLLAPLAAQAASTSTARATGNTLLRSGPGNDYNVIGRLQPGTEVNLADCTSNDNWCLVVLDGRQVGWARGSFLVGFSAKIQAGRGEHLYGNSLRFRDSWDD